MQNLKIEVRQKNGVLSVSDPSWVRVSVKYEKQPGVTNGVIIVYVHEKINILLSVLSISFSFFLMILTWIHKVLYI